LVNTVVEIILTDGLTNQYHIVYRLMRLIVDKKASCLMSRERYVYIFLLVLILCVIFVL